MSQRRWTVLLSWFAAVSSVAGQISDVTQCISTYEWALNSLGQTPCFVAAILESVCGSFENITSLPLPLDNHYLGPTLVDATPCECSSVTYSMISACGGCQNHTFTDWLTWTGNCTATSFMTFPKSIPSSIVVPSWAYLNLTLTNNDFNPIVAEQNATATASSTSVSTSSSTPTSVSTGNSKSNAGAIAGGVVGGLVFLAIIGLVALWYILPKKRNMVQKDVTFDSQALMSGPSLSQATQGPSLLSQSIYTSDMSTFPGSPLTTSGVFTTIPPSRRSLESLSLSVAQLGGGPQNHGTPAQRGYTGMPEI